MQFNNETPTMTLRANRLSVTREQLADMLTGSGVTTTPAVWAPDGLAVTGGNPFRADLPGTLRRAG